MLPPGSPPAAQPVHAPSPEDSELPPWAQQTAPVEETHWQRLHRWIAGEFEDEPVPAHVWFKAEYVFAWIRSDHTPPLLTTGLTTDTSPGALGLPFTKGIVPTDVNYEDRGGMRITLGTALNDAWTIEGSYLFLDGRKPEFMVTSPGTPVVARPFFNVNAGIQDSSLTTYPGLLSGSAEVRDYSYLEGAELNLRTDLWCSDCFRVHGLVGARWLNLREGLDITEFGNVTLAGPLNGLPIGDRDSFRARNDFYGGQLGLDTEFEYLHFKFDVFGKCAIGDMMQQARVQGGTDLFGTFIPGGLLAVSSNMGTYSRDRLGIVPEAGFKIERPIGRHASFFVGYSFLYMNDVLRPGSMVDTNVNVNLVPTSATFGAAGGPARPTFRFQDNEFWVHMFQAGLTFHW